MRYLATPVSTHKDYTEPFGISSNVNEPEQDQTQVLVALEEVLSFLLKITCIIETDTKSPHRVARNTDRKGFEC